MPRPRIHVSTGRGVSVLDVPHPARDRWRSGAHQQHVKVLGVRGVAVRLAQRKREKVQQRCHHQRARAVHRVLAQHVDQAGDSAHATAAVVRWGASRGGRWWGRAGRGSREASGPSHVCVPSTVVHGMQLYPGDLKTGVADALNAYLAPIRKKFEDPALVALTKAAYPDKMPTHVTVAPVAGLDDDDVVAAAAEANAKAAAADAKAASAAAKKAAKKDKPAASPAPAAAAASAPADAPAAAAPAADSTTATEPGTWLWHEHRSQSTLTSGFHACSLTLASSQHPHRPRNQSSILSFLRLRLKPFFYILRTTYTRSCTKIPPF